MERLTLHTLKPLIEQISEHDQVCISIYLPMETAGPDTRKNPILYKNAIASAKQQLQERYPDQPELTEPLIRQLDRTHSLDTDAFWQNQNQGLALYITPEGYDHFSLPYSPRQGVWVDRHLYAKPLFPYLAEDSPFMVLALSQNHVRLLECDRDTVQEVDLGDLPRNIDEALRFDDPEQQIQYFTVGQRGRSELFFHGHGDGSEEGKEQIRRYLQVIDTGLQPKLTARGVPLVVAGVDYVESLYRQISTYPHIEATGIRGNPDHKPIETLHQEAWPIIAAHFSDQQEQIRSNYAQLSDSGLISAQISDVLIGAAQGRVDSLLVASEHDQWGQMRWDPTQATAPAVEYHDQPQPDSRELINLAVIETLLHGGEIYVQETQKMPQTSPLAAIFRYPL